MADERLDPLRVNIYRAVNDITSAYAALRHALVIVANVGSGEAQRVALEALRRVDDRDGTGKPEDK